MLDGCTCTSSVDIAYTAKIEHSLICQCLGNQLPLSSSFPPSHPTPFPHHLYTTPTFTPNSTPTPSLHHLHLHTQLHSHFHTQLHSHLHTQLHSHTISTPSPPSHSPDCWQRMSALLALCHPPPSQTRPPGWFLRSTCETAQMGYLPLHHGSCWLETERVKC